MKIFKINDVKGFMKLFLNSAAFDDFQLVELTIKKYTTIIIDGHANEDFYKNDENYTLRGNEYASWAELRPLCMELIKGRNTPLYMKYVLQKNPSAILPPSGEPLTDKAASEARSLLLNIAYSEQLLTLTTAVNFTGFYPDSTLPSIWDSYIENLLKNNSLDYSDFD